MSRMKTGYGLLWTRLWRKDTVGWGLCAINGTGIGACFIASRFIAGECISSIARDYGIGESAVEDAIRLFLCGLRGQSGEQVETRMADILKHCGRDLTDSEPQP